MLDEYIDIIRNEDDGEIIRTAIINALNELQGESTTPIVLLDSYDEFLLLDDETKNNGTIYMISDIVVIDGDDLYFGTK
jgi:hypothetical protein